MVAYNRLAAVCLVIGAAFPAVGQDGVEKSRLDDFAIPQNGDETLKIDQVSPGAESVRGAPQPKDRSIAGSPMSERPTLRPDQLTTGDAAVAPSQLSTGADPTSPIPSAGSTAADSRPQSVTRLTGSDRCDPQLPGRDLARCLQILELRAQEFNAPRAPELSAEQSLLANQSEDEFASVHVGRNRLRFATVQEPDADLDSNQELASIYLTVPAAPPIRQPEDFPEEAETLADIIVAITQGSPPQAP